MNLLLILFTHINTLVQTQTIPAMLLYYVIYFSGEVFFTNLILYLKR